MAVATATHTIRDLPPEEWPRLLDFEPWLTHQAMPPTDAPWRFLVAEVHGEIVGYCALYTAVHWEPWVIRPEYRKRPDIVRGLIREGLSVLAEADAQVAFCLAAEDTAALVEHFGFVKNPQSLYVVHVPAIRV